MKSDNPGLPSFERQTTVTLNQAAPVNGTDYPLLDVTGPHRVYEVGCGVEDANETLEVRVTVDGVLIGPIAFAATHSTAYFVDRYTDAIALSEFITIQLAPPARAFMFECHSSLLIEIRKTTALGAGNLTGIASYGEKQN